jgi:hypothetical protein
MLFTHGNPLGFARNSFTEQRIPLHPGVLGATLLGVTLSFPADLLAFCRTTTCDTGASCEESPESCCVLDENSCDINGEFVHWPKSCVSYNTHEEGSARSDISGKQLSEIVAAAFESWLSVDCNGAPLSLSIEYRGLSSCGIAEFNKEPNQPNANVWMFRDLGMDSPAIALTTVMLDLNRAEIVAADVEFNSALFDFTLGEQEVKYDLLSVATHEAGHFLGLADSVNKDATMDGYYDPGDLAPRTLDPDDVAGVCAIYPADREIKGGAQNCEPYGGYSPDCFVEEGCSCDTRRPFRPSSTGPWFSTGFLGVLVLRRLRRQHSRSD